MYLDLWSWFLMWTANLQLPIDIYKTPWPLAKAPANSKMGYFQAPKLRNVEPFSADVYPLFTCPESTRRATWLKPRPRHPWPAHRITSMLLGFSHLSRYFTNLGLSGHLHWSNWFNVLFSTRLPLVTDSTSTEMMDFQLASKLNLAANPGLQNLFTKP